MRDEEIIEELLSLASIISIAIQYPKYPILAVVQPYDGE